MQWFNCKVFLTWKIKENNAYEYIVTVIQKDLIRPNM